MKTIKEKAEEYTRDYLFSSEPRKPINAHFEAGANYVIDAIEEVLNLPHQCTFETLKTNIEDVIEQLKSNQ